LTAVSLYLGLIATDGVNDSPIAAFGVILYSPAGVMSAIRDKLDELTAQQATPATVKRSLRELLTNAVDSFKAEDLEQAVHYIRLFQTRIKSQPRFLDPATRQGLIDAAEAVVAVARL
jgi:hypothetical protein